MALTALRDELRATEARLEARQGEKLRAMEVRQREELRAMEARQRATEARQQEQFAELPRRLDSTQQRVLPQSPSIEC